TLAVNAANTYAGPVTVQQGALQLQDPGALGSNSAKSIVTLAPSSTLNLRSDGPYPANFGNDVVVQDDTPVTPATITTGTINNAPATAGKFQLGALRIGDATLATGGAGGSLEFTGIVTLNANARFNTSRGLLLSDRITGGGSITKQGSSMLTFGSGPADAKANTYAGLTTIAGGVLQLNKAAGTTAIPGDIAISGGTLVPLQPRQIADNSSLLLTGGTFDMAGQTDAIQNLTNNGANIVVDDGASLTVSATTINGGVTTIGSAPGSVPPPPPPSSNRPGGLVQPPAAVTTVTSTYTTDTMTVTDGTVTVNPGGSLNIGAGGLFFTGAASPTLTLISD